MNFFNERKVLSDETSLDELCLFVKNLSSSERNFSVTGVFEHFPYSRLEEVILAGCNLSQAQSEAFFVALTTTFNQRCKSFYKQLTTQCNAMLSLTLRGILNTTAHKITQFISTLITFE